MTSRDPHTQPEPAGTGSANSAPGGSGNTSSAAAPGRGAQPHGEGAMGQTEHVHTVVPEAKWGVTSGAPSGGTAGGTPAQQIADILEDE